MQQALAILQKAAIRVMEVFQPTSRQDSAHHGQKAIKDLPFARAGTACGVDIRGVQLAGLSRMGMKLGERLMGQPERRAGADIRADQIAVCCKHAVGVCE